MIPTTTPREALEALRIGHAKAQAMLVQAKTATRRDIAVFWCDYFDRQIRRWECKQ